LVRNRGADRLAEKPSKRDLAQSESNLHALERHRMDSGGAIPLPYRFVRIDSTRLSAKQTAELVIDALGLASPST
jgi:hypothetical protein